MRQFKRFSQKDEYVRDVRELRWNNSSFVQSIHSPENNQNA